MKSKEVYVGITLFIVGLLYFLFQYNSESFFKILKHWPIFILLAGVLMEFIAIHLKIKILWQYECINS
jgi:predicted membrane protein